MSTEEKKPEPTKACPCCDIIAMAKNDKEPLALMEAVAIGASMGALAGDLGAVSGAMCDRHKFPWLLACLSGIERLERLERVMLAREGGGAEPPKDKPQPDRSLS
jgi:hypothetical protein